MAVGRWQAAFCEQQRFVVIEMV